MQARGIPRRKHLRVDPSHIEAKVAAAERRIAENERATAKAIESVRMRAEEAEATAAYLANEASKLREENKGLRVKSQPPPAPVLHVPRPAPPLMGPALPKSLTQNQAVSPNHYDNLGASPP